MATAQQVLATAAGELGYTRWDDPEEGSKYGRWYAQDHGPYFGASGVPFCAMFASWVLAQWGIAPPGGAFAYVPAGISAARARGRLVDFDDAEPGDLICFDWDGDGVADHIGFVIQYRGRGVYDTIEGNTSSGWGGSQSNGGGVYQRVRDVEDVCAIIRPDYSGAAAPAPTEPEAKPYTGGKAVDGQAELIVDGGFGPATIARFQQVMGTAIDGELDEDGSPAVEKFQQFLNAAVPAASQAALNNGSSALAVDGELGPDTWRAFQYLVLAWGKPGVPAGWGFGDWIDGDAGEATIKALQMALNASYAYSGRLWA